MYLYSSAYAYASIFIYLGLCIYMYLYVSILICPCIHSSLDMFVCLSVYLNTCVKAPNLTNEDKS